MGSGARAKVPKKLQKAQENTLLRRFPCHLCPKSYASKGELNRHIQFGHEKKYEYHLICKIGGWKEETH